MSDRTPRLPSIWTVSVSRLSSLLRDVTPEFDKRAHIETINLGFEEAARHIRRRLLSEDCDVLLAAGSNGAYLKSRIDKPLVLIRASGFDLMQALTRAHRLAPRIGVVTHETEMPAFAEFQKSFGLKIEQRAFVTAEDARDCVSELTARGVGAIVGTGLVVDLAESAGVAGVLMYSAASIREAFENALDVAEMMSRQTSSQTARRGGSRRGNVATTRYRLPDLLGRSAEMQRVRDTVRRYAASEATVLITGATGTGKELVAHAIHEASPRASGPFVAVNCGAIAESLLESELFGHEEGAFTGSRRGGRGGLIEAAHRGTLFLDEIGEMPLALQTRLLRVLEEREVVRVGSTQAQAVDIRVIAATHVDLDTVTRANAFRRDLYYRLNVLRLQLPALAGREEDITQLAQAFLQRRDPSLRLGEDALDLLRRYGWPGNVRELRNLIDRLPVLLGEDRQPRLVDARTLLECAPELANREGGPTASASAAPPRRPDREALLDALAASGGDRRRAAERLGVSRTTLWRWLRETGQRLA